MESTFDVNVNYYDEEDFSYPSVDIKFQYNGFKIYWNILEACTKTTNYVDWLNEWVSIKDSLINGTKSGHVSGGGNSFWCCSASNKELDLEYSISGSGGDSTFSIRFPSEFILPLVDKLIHICECANKNEEVKI